ncbi:MAG TPA: fibronectin type III domain-containing protein [Candidatus Eisenbacteria bacterium]|nr:fibronectin type III domain-containing protein [Candidatus Eisenbacteria bacterium]
MLVRHPNPGPTARRSRGALVAATLLALTAALSVAPPFVRDAFAQTSADSTVVLNWTAPGDDGTSGRATTYDVRYRTTAISGTDTLTWWNGATAATGEPLPGVSGSTDSLRVRGLQPLTTYYFLIKTADEVPNWSGYSNLAVKTTSGDVTPPSAIANLSVTGATGTSLSLSWTAPGDDGSTGTAASYDIRYSTSPITSANWASATTVTGEPAPSAAGTAQAFVVTGLSPSRTYYVAIKTTDDRSNVSALSNVPSGTTLDTIPPAAVRDLSYSPAGGPSSRMNVFAEAPVAERHESF